MVFKLCSLELEVPQELGKVGNHQGGDGEGKTRGSRASLISLEPELLHFYLCYIPKNPQQISCQKESSNPEMSLKASALNSYYICQSMTLTYSDT